MFFNTKLYKSLINPDEALSSLKSLKKEKRMHKMNYNSPPKNIDVWNVFGILLGCFCRFEGRFGQVWGVFGRYFQHDVQGYLGSFGEVY